MSLKGIAGNRTVTDRLRKMVASHRVPSSLLFTGPEGSGKRDTALNLAKAVNCLRAADGGDDACDTCSACVRIEHNGHPDVRRIAPEGPGGQVRAEAVRQVVAESPFRPFEGRKRVYLFEEADRMNPTAANTLLKTLEEPPPWTVLVLITANDTAVLPTLLSRCQKIRFLPLSTDEVAEILVRDYRAPAGEAALAAGASGGNLNRAIALMPELGALREEALRLASLPAESAGRARLIPWADHLAKNPQLPMVLRITACMLRDLASLAGGGSALHAESSNDLTALAKLRPLGTWLEAYLRVERTIQNLETRYTNKRITLEHTLLGMESLGRRLS